METINEAKRKPNIDIDIEYSKLWYSQISWADESVYLRITHLLDLHQRGKRFRGVNKLSEPPFKEKGIWHCHVNQNAPDPLIFYQIIVNPGQNKILWLIAVSTHDEAFKGNEEVFYQSIEDNLYFRTDENVMRKLIKIVEGFLPAKN